MVTVSLSVADAISSTNPRVIDDARARKLSSDLKRCTYYETCATYGLNVERVFQDGKCSLPRAHVPFPWCWAPLGTRGPQRESERPLHAEGVLRCVRVQTRVRGESRVARTR